MVVSEESVIQRFEGAHAATKEAVETISLWILHYKDKQSIEKIVDVWIRVFKNACSDSHRTALFYIMNDAVQNAKRKHIDYLIPAFQPAVLSAITEARGSSKVKKVMARCIEIFREREVFTKASVTAMQNILHGTETGDIDDGCLELNNSEVCMNIEAFDEGCKVSEELKEIVMRTNFETFNMLKRRVVDKRAAYYELERTKDVQEILTEVRHSLEAQKKRMLELVETLEIAKRLYSHSLKEVAVVEDAYVKYYKEIADTKRELLDMKTSGVYPAATPPRDCPSPTANDDLFADGFSSPFRDNQGSTAMDMEIDDEEPMAATSVPSAMSVGTPVTTFPQEFNLPPPNWMPSGASNIPPPGVLPMAFNLPPPQLVSPAAMPPPYIPGLPPNFSAPPPSTSAQDLRQAPGFNQQTPPVVNSQAFASQPSGSQETPSRHQTERNTSYSSERRGDIHDRNFDGYQDRRDSFNHGRRGGGADRNNGYERGNGGFRRDSWDRNSDNYGGRDRDGNRGFRGRGGGGSGNMDQGTLVDGVEVDRCGERDAGEEPSTAESVADDEQVFRLPKGIVLADPVKNSPEEISELRGFWRRTLKELGITKIVAPMVDQSELAFRMMLRDNGAHLTYTPMIHAHLFVNDHTYRRNSLAFCKKDRPLIVQFCANKPDTFLAACRLVEGYCDGVDLNLGCPQMVAKRGRYGAYLQEQVDLVCEMVTAVRDYCKLPISCKIRIRDCPEETRDYAKRLVEAGATMLTVHGRTREMKGGETGVADWERIKQIVDCVDVPVIANGNIQMPGDVERCIAATGAVAVMSAEGILYNPLLFAEQHKESWEVAAQYLDYARRFQAGTSAVRAHVFRIMHHSLLEFADLRLRVSTEHRLEDFESVVEEVRRRVRELADPLVGQTATETALSLFSKIRGGETLDTVKVALTPHWLCKPYFRLPERVKEAMLAEGEKSYKQQRKEELQKKADKLGISIKQAKKRDKRKIQHEKVLICKKAKFPPCERCTQPAGQGCRQKMCKRCCKYISKQQRLDCGAHKARWSHLPPIEAASAEVDPVS